MNSLRINVKSYGSNGGTHILPSCRGDGFAIEVTDTTQPSPCPKLVIRIRYLDGGVLSVWAWKVRPSKRAADGKVIMLREVVDSLQYPIPLAGPIEEGK